MLKQKLTLLSLVLSALSSQAFSATTTTMGTFDAYSFNNDYSFESSDPPDGSGNISIGRTPILGLTKFDPNLGTLNKIIVNADFDYTITSTIEVINVIDFELPTHSASFVASSSGGDGDRSYAYLRYTKGSSSFFLTEEFFKPTVSCQGSAEYCFNTESLPPISFDSPLDILNTPPKSGQVASGLIDINDFVGAGAITALNMAILLPDGSLWETDNVLEAYGSIEVAFTSGTVSIEYDYSPTVVPVPGAIWLFASAMGGFFGMRRMNRRRGA